MTAHHIRQRQIKEEAAKINRAYEAAAVTAPELFTPEQREAMKNRALEVLLTDSNPPPLNFKDSKPPYVDPYDAPNLQSGYMPPVIGEGAILNEPEAPDMLAGLGLRAEDLAAIQGQVDAVIRPMMRDHYRAQFMAAVISAGSNMLHFQGVEGEGLLLDKAEAIAEGALIRMGYKP